ncbi:MAG: sigma-70 family RNA polymerase sigma factor [Lachnospiraceae bacterium]|nr:sigma-70 family RNA polymerase sigma factor [Lachnospiraceae bacterium]
MRLNEKERRLVEDNINLVHKVINDKVKCMNLISAYSREDLFQIGCIGLCKAAATDKGGCFSTYAYRLIWNEICDALKVNSRKWSNEVAVEMLPESIFHDESDEIESMIMIYSILRESGKHVPPSTRKGINALLLMDDGYSCREIGYRYGASANLITAWISKARKYLRSITELKELADSINAA